MNLVSLVACSGSLCNFTNHTPYIGHYLRPVCHQGKSGSINPTHFDGLHIVWRTQNCTCITYLCKYASFKWAHNIGEMWVKQPSLMHITCDQAYAYPTYMLTQSTQYSGWTHVLHRNMSGHSLPHMLCPDTSSTTIIFESI